MLTSIIVERLGVIERAELELGGGSVAVTGETGAGKTLVVSAASLLLGARADRSLVRSGSEDAAVAGRFVVPADHPAVELLRERGIPVGAVEEEAEIVVVRTVAVDPKRNRVRVNGSLVPLTVLADIGPMLVEIAGQNEHSRVTSPAYQRSLLDGYAGSSDRAARVAELVRRARSETERAEDLAAEERQRRRDLETLRQEVNEIERAAPKVGELEELEGVARRLEAAADLAAGCERVSSLLRGEGGAEEMLGEAAATLDALVPHDPALGDLAARLKSAGVEVGDVAAEVASAGSDVDLVSLDDVQERIATLRGLRRRFGDDESAVLAHAAWSRARIDELESAEEMAAGAARTAAAMTAEAHGLAVELSERRAAAAPRLAAAVAQRLSALALGGARFQVELVPKELSEGGAEDVVFRVAANPGEEPAPLGRVASGGELSRIALALHLITTPTGTRTMVFDEVDAGVGGTAAVEVGRSLAQLARDGMQVIVVTHLPQVAAFADEHHVVSKEVDDERARAVVRKVEGEARVGEVTRMLAGLPESERGREHARELLELSAGGVPAA